MRMCNEDGLGWEFVGCKNRSGSVSGLGILCVYFVRNEEDKQG